MNFLIKKTTIFLIAVSLQIFAAILYAQNSNRSKSGDIIIDAEGICFLGSGITEKEAKTIAIDDAKRAALEKAGIYLESHTHVVDYKLTKDEVISYTASILKMKLLSYKPELVNERFRVRVRIQATINTELLWQRIEEIQSNYELKRQLDLHQKQNLELKLKIDSLQRNSDFQNKGYVSNTISKLNARELYDKALLETDSLQIIKFCSAAISLDSTNPMYYTYRGMAYESLGMLKKAFNDFRKSLYLKPDYDFALNALGNYYMHTSDYDSAISYYKSAINAYSDNFGYYYNLGRAYCFVFAKDNDKDICYKAIKYIDQSILINPDHPHSYSLRATMYMSIGDFNQALKDTEKAINLGGESTLIYGTKGKIYFHIKNYSEAIEAFTHAIIRGANDFEYFQKRGMSYSILKMPEKSIADFNKALKLNPNDINCLLCRGMDYRNLGMNNDAIKDLTKAISIDPNEHVAYDNRARANLSLGNEKDAIRDWEQYLKIVVNKNINNNYANEIRKHMRSLGYISKY